jgi:hypothetical protein
MSIRWRVAAGALLCVLLGAQRVARAEGEGAGGFPNWSERVLLEWINRARSDPQADLAACPSGNCTEKSCFTPQPPRVWNAHIAHSARFHSDEMARDNFFDHWSECNVVSTIATSYLNASCSGTAACACTGGTRSLGAYNGSDPYARMSLFGGGYGGWGEIIAWDSGPDDSFYLWLYEPTSDATCSYHDNDDNGHRWLILTSQYGAASAGPGVSGALSTVDFDDEAGSNPKIPSGTHYPQQAGSVDMWVNWNDSAGPLLHHVDIDGVCTDLSLARGSQTNGAWHATVSGVGSGCHRYFYEFQDSGGNIVRYPTTGSLAIGDGSAQCADWAATTVAPCVDAIFKDKFGG